MDKHEDIYLEVERRLETLKTNGVVTVSRDLKMVQDVDTHKMPALYLTGGTWSDRIVAGGRRERDLLVSVHCYMQVSESSSPLSELNDITNKVLSLFPPDTNRGIVCNLGGKCDSFDAIRASVLSEGRIDKNKSVVIIDFQATFRVGNC